MKMAAAQITGAHAEARYDALKPIPASPQICSTLATLPFAKRDAMSGPRPAPTPLVIGDTRNEGSENETNASETRNSQQFDHVWRRLIVWRARAEGVRGTR